MPPTLRCAAVDFCRLPVRAMWTAGNGDPQMLLTTTGSFRTDADGYLGTESGLDPAGLAGDLGRNNPDICRAIQVRGWNLSGST